MSDILAFSKAHVMAGVPSLNWIEGPKTNPNATPHYLSMIFGKVAIGNQPQVYGTWTNNADQAWSWDSTNKQISAGSFCMVDPADGSNMARLATCDASNAQQQWNYNANNQFINADSSNALSITPPIAPMVANTTYSAPVIMASSNPLDPAQKWRPEYNPLDGSSVMYRDAAQ